MDAEAIRDIFRQLGLVHVRRMFGGHGIYHGELMFALESDGELYLKADEKAAAFFRDLGSRPFVYTGRDGRTVTMSYWLMPESALDDPDEAVQLAGRALEAARRARTAQARKPKAPRSPKARKESAEPAT